MRLRLALCLLALTACGRSLIYQPAPAPSPGACSLGLEPATLDFGSVAPGAQKDLQVTVENLGDGSCHLKDIALATGGAEGFALAPGTPSSLTLSSGGAAFLALRFVAPVNQPPFDRAGTLVFSSDDPALPTAKVPLKAHLPQCQLSAAPSALHFGPLHPTGSAEQAVTLSNPGELACELSGLRLDGDASFTVPVAGPLQLAPGASQQVPVRFTAPSAMPLKREARLLAYLAGGSAPAAEVALVGDVQLCVLTASPSPFAFGNVPLNTTSTHPVTVSNVGTDLCTLLGAQLAPPTDPGFTLPAPPGATTLSPGASTAVALTFSAFDSAPPHLKTGVLRLATTDPAQPALDVPLSAYVNTLCTQAGQYIYTVDVGGTFSRFDPASLSSTTIGQLSCPTSPSNSPFSMNLDQNAVAWVLFMDGNIFTVDTATGACAATSYVPGQKGMQVFGMGSVFDAAQGTDTLYLAGGATFPVGQSTLGTLDLTTLTTSVIGQTTVENAELAGTGDGQLWAFSPGSPGPSGTTPLLARLDPATGTTLEQYQLASISSFGGYAVKFWGGAFYIFIGADVWQVARSTLVPGMTAPTSPPTLVFTSPGLDVVGAGVSTCAPVQGP